MRKPYPAYKDSGIEWIERIPSHWKRTKLKYISCVITGNTPSKNNEENYDNGKFLWVKPDEIKGFYPTNETKEKLTKKGKSLSRVIPKYSVFVNGIGDIGRFGFSEKEVSTNQQINSLILNERCNYRFGLYLISIMIEEFRKQSEKVVVSILNKSRQENVKTFIPSLPEQQKIALFLDYKTERIDELIEKTKFKIELLKEKRTSLINHCVTKGLNPDVKMKDSGVEWIGKIPVHWKVKPLKYVCNYNQFTLSNMTDPNYELEYIEISDVNSDGIILNKTHYRFADAPSRCRRILHKNDVFISTVRTYLKSIGFVQDQVNDLICSTGFCVISTNEEMVSKLLFYIMRSNWFISNVISLSEGVSYPSVQSNKLVGIKVVVPPESEQKELVNYLDEKSSKYENLIDKENRRIELLKEYYKSLISEAVTGKIDVRDEVAV